MVKRLSRGVRRRPEIGQAAKLFAKALPLREHREVALDGEACAGRGRCKTCDDYEALVAEIATIMDVATYEVHPIDAADVPAPPWWKPDQVEAWEKARKLYVELCTAAGVTPRRHLVPRELDEALVIVRWIERMIPVPAGFPAPGAPLRLRDWQRDVVRQIYDSTGKQVRDVLDGIGEIPDIRE